MADATIRQRTTPTHTFTTTFSTSLISELEITYKQNGVVLVKKTLEDVTLDENAIIVELTTAETSLFHEIGTVGIQVWARDTEGKALLSDIFPASVYPSQSKETT